MFNSHNKTDPGNHFKPRNLIRQFRNHSDSDMKQYCKTKRKQDPAQMGEKQSFLVA